MNLLYGISGIGTGHSNRQMPLLEHFATHARIVIFAYNESFRIYQQKFGDKENVTVVPINIPFIAGNLHGLDWKATARINEGKDFNTVNSHALAEAQQILGKPDLVISDYEPLSAQYAYSYDAPFVTLDQQSKYLCGRFPEFPGQSFQDEIMRLRMFFPKATARIACSFFNVDTRQNKYCVRIFPPTLKEQIINLKRGEGNSVLIYISSQKTFVQNIEDVLDICAQQKESFDLFLKDVPHTHLPSNVSVYEYGDPHFYQALSRCKAIISTAGHTLLSEALYLGIPVYAIPLGVYEQHMNAHVLQEHGFGFSRPNLDKQSLEDFLQHIPVLKAAILNNSNILLRRPGQKEILAFLEQVTQQ